MSNKAIDDMQAMRILNEFALKHKVVLEQKGKVGFGRPCVGFTYGHNYIDYNPYKYVNHEPVDISEVYSDLFHELAPANAYHKHTCLCVLVEDGKYKDALAELAKWVTDLEKHNVCIVDFSTGATGMQAEISGKFGKTLKLN